MKDISLLGGSLELISEGFFNELKYNNKSLLGVDHGSLFLVEEGLIPDVTVGNFDSLKKAELAKTEKVVKDIRYSNPVKNLTDSKLMIGTAFEDYHLASLKIYGATGGRLDHPLASLSTFLKSEFRIYVLKVTLIDRQSIIRLFLSRRHHIKPLEGYSCLGIINSTEVKNLSIQGAKYPLENYISAYPVSFAPDEFIVDKSVELYFEKGTTAVIYSKNLSHSTSLQN